MLKVSHTLKKAYSYEQLPPFIKNVIKKEDVARINFPPGSIAIDLHPKLYFFSELSPILRLGVEKIKYITATGDNLRFIFSL